MPRGDRRGPDGAGPMSGRGLGYCSGNNQPGFSADAAPQGTGRGLRNGAGRGPGFGRGCRSTSKGHGFARGAGRSRGRGYGFAAGSETEVYSERGSEDEDFASEEARNREVTRLENIANTLTSELEIVKNKIAELKNN